jgi:hypothetical protein
MTNANETAKIETYMVTLRIFPNGPLPRTYSTLDDAVREGLAGKRAFDVHVRSGAVAWVWEMRP